MKTDVRDQTKDGEPEGIAGELHRIASSEDHPSFIGKGAVSQAMPSSISAPNEIDDFLKGPLSRDI